MEIQVVERFERDEQHRPRRSESHLEKFIADFVWEKVTERVRLHLADDITVRPTEIRQKGGAFLLATFWANVLQHKLNFPPSHHSYRRHDVTTDVSSQRRDLLELNLETDGIQIFVDMMLGTVTISGKFVYNWFTTGFQKILENFDEVFSAKWVFVPTPSGDLHVTPAHDVKLKYEKSETELYLLLEGRGSQPVDQKIMDRLNTVEISDSSEVVCHSPPDSKAVWSSEETDSQLRMLSHGGGLFDAFKFVYPLWRSVLHRWFSHSDGATVYLASPLLDINHLCDLIDICLQYRDSNVQLAAFYINFHCSSSSSAGSAMDAGTVQQHALRCYSSAARQALAECLVLRRIVYPLKRRVGATFLGRVRRDGTAEVLLTSAAFHSSDLCADKLATAVFFQTTREAFVGRYVEPFEVLAVTTSLLPS